MVRKTTRMEVKEVGKKIKYLKSEKAISTMCAVTAKDDEGVEHEAFVWDNLCDKIKEGTAVVATKEFSPNRGNARFIIIGLEE